MKILILKPSSLGDVVQALPVLRLLRRAKPDAEIYWWVDSNLVSLLEGDPDLTGIFRFQRDRWAAPKHWTEIARVILAMRREKFDWVIDLQSLARSGAFAWFANGAFTIGLDERREGATAFYDVAVPRASYHTHAVDWYLAVLARLGVPVHQDFDWLPERAEVAAAVRRKWPVENKRWLIIQPGGRWPNKRWSDGNYAEVVRQLAAKFPELHFAVVGGAGDKAAGDIIAGGAPGRCLNLAGQTSLPEMVEWIRLGGFVVTNDTGPMHVAAALRKPMVALFGPTEPRRTGPYGRLEQVLRQPLPCAPCLKPTCANVKQLECLQLITPAMVVAEVEKRIPNAGG